MTDDPVLLAIRYSTAFKELELSYIANFVNSEEGAVFWMRSVGLFSELMIEHVESEEALANFARFMPDKEKKEDIREKIATDSRGAFIWGVWVPEDSDVVKDKIQGSKWAYRWAKHVGDAEEMLKRADHPYWRNKIKAEAIEYESASFH